METRRGWPAYLFSRYLHGRKRRRERRGETLGGMALSPLDVDIGWLFEVTRFG